MRKATLSLLFIFLFIGISYAQYSDNRPDGLAPYKKDMNPVSVTVSNPDNSLSYFSRAFAYKTGTPKGMCSFFLNNPATLLMLGADAGANFLSGASFDGSGHLYAVRYYTNELYQVDTSTGALTQIAIVGTANSGLNGIAWDPSTSAMYGVFSNGTTLQLGTINLTNGNVTMIGSTVASFSVIDIAFSNSGVCYGHRFVSPSGSIGEIVTINKTTNAITVVGPTGFAGWYAQGMSWDRSVDSCYLAGYNVTTSTGNLYKVNTTTGACTVVGPLGAGASVELDAMAIPGNAGPMVTHTPLPNTQNVAGPYAVNAAVNVSGTTITSSKILWSRNNLTVTDSVTMTNSSGSNWTGNIPGNGTNATYRYYIKAVDALGRIGTHPMGAPASLNTFTASATDTSKPVITHTPIGPTPKTSWPIHCVANVTDNIGIDSVWVRWYKNTTANYKQFKLLLTSGTTYDAIFNSVNADVVAGDIIYYRVIAQDNSAQHLKDSTALLQFNIIAQFNGCIGTGSVSSNFPFTTYWMDGRTQMLFTAAELNTAGATVPVYIQKIGFNVISVGGPIMNGFNVRYQHTTATSLTAFVETGWTTAFSGSYAPPATGWQYIDMTAPFFVYNGTGNLLVEICYDNSAYTAYSPVNSTSIAGMTWGYNTDNVTGCTMTGGATQASRPNTCFTMSPVVSVGNNNGITPTKYSLSQNYPNPFNPVTRINFEIPKQGFVNVKIFDVLGREIRTLVNEVKAPGIYAVDFNASELSSGVYFYRLESNGFTDIKRMMLIK